ncbi:MAG: GlsB/YeaQ/YmgE family stress response membrane protein [Sphingomonas sp.]|nr:MAG: GlsB/YeaQ/YmgE family stress response membrane protein [Sphingomonas sp.]
MGIIIWLIIGGVVGWLAGLIMRDNNSVLVNVVVGIVGAFIGGLIFSGGTINQAPLDVTSFLVSLLGAVILLAIVNLVRRGRVR